MSLKWDVVEKWREESGISKAELARAAGIPETTIYAGLRNHSRLQPSMRAVMRTVFPEKFDEKGEVVS